MGCVGTIEHKKKLAKQIRLETLKELTNLGFGHVGGSMSICEVLAVLYGGSMKYDAARPNWEDRDYLIVSKGHSGPAVYAALALSGFFPMEVLPTGDGILAGLRLLEVMKLENKSLDKLNNISLMPQISTNINVKDKVRIKNSEELSELVKTLSENFDGRIIVRCSGTENKIRVLVEGKSKTKLKNNCTSRNRR